MKIQKLDLPKKPEYIKFSQDRDFFVLFKSIEQEFENCFFLESLGEESHTARYSIIGFDPEQIISAEENNLYVTQNSEKNIYPSENPYRTLQEIIPQNIISRQYAGGLVGYIGFDAVSYFEPSLSIQKHPLFSSFKFGVFTDGLVYDKMTGETFYFYYLKNRINKIQEIASRQTKRGKVFVTNQGQTKNFYSYEKMISEIKRDIVNGLIFQCVVGFKEEFTIKGDTLNIYERLRQTNPSPHMYFIKFGKEKIIGASPELLFRMRDGYMETFPLAGTIKRGQTRDEDMVLARELLNDPKELAEHKMLVDLHRNDIGRVARFNTVRVNKLLEIKKYSHVQHISSEISGMIKNDEDMFSALASNFPAGTLTGAPKIEAIKILNQHEDSPRGPYGGAVGHFGFNGDCTFAIPIRTLFIHDDYAFHQAGSGIVYDSVAEKEYEEIMNKLAGMKVVLEVMTPP